MPTIFSQDPLLRKIQTALETAFNADSGTVSKIARDVILATSDQIEDILRTIEDSYRQRVNLAAIVIAIYGAPGEFNNRAFQYTLVDWPFSVFIIERRPRATESGREADKTVIDLYANAVVDLLNLNRFSDSKICTTRIDAIGSCQEIEDDGALVRYIELKFYMQYLSHN